MKPELQYCHLPEYECSSQEQQPPNLAAGCWFVTGVLSDSTVVHGDAMPFYPGRLVLPCYRPSPGPWGNLTVSTCCFPPRNAPHASPGVWGTSSSGFLYLWPRIEREGTQEPCFTFSPCLYLFPFDQQHVNLKSDASSSSSSSSIHFLVLLVLFFFFFNHLISLWNYSCICFLAV